MKIIQERDTTTIRQTVIFSASPEQVYEVLMDSEKHESLSGEKANISREVGAPSRRGESIFPGSTWCFSPVGELSRLGAPMIGGPITIQSSRLTYAHWMVARSFASRRSACRPTDSTVILADGSYWQPMQELCDKGSVSDQTRAGSAAARQRIDQGNL